MRRKRAAALATGLSYSLPGLAHADVVDGIGGGSKLILSVFVGLAVIGLVLVLVIVRIIVKAIRKRERPSGKPVARIHRDS